MSGRIRVQKMGHRWWCLAGYLSVCAPRAGGDDPEAYFCSRGAMVCSPRRRG